jgi:hypothetical protein
MPGAWIGCFQSIEVNFDRSIPTCHRDAAKRDDHHNELEGIHFREYEDDKSEVGAVTTECEVVLHLTFGRRDGDRD